MIWHFFLSRLLTKPSRTLMPSGCMQDQCRRLSEANGGGTVFKQGCVTDNSSSVSYPAHMGIYACDEQPNFQHLIIL